jgi:hypothetical protein
MSKSQQLMASCVITHTKLAAKIDSLKTIKKEQPSAGGVPTIK